MQYVVIIIDGHFFTINLVNFMAWLENPQIVHHSLEAVGVSINSHLDVEYVLVVVGYDLTDNKS